MEYKYFYDCNRLRDLGVQMNLTQAQLAERLDVATNTMSRWEVGLSVPSAHVLVAIYSVARQRGLNLETDYFLSERPDVGT